MPRPFQPSCLDHPIIISLGEAPYYKFFSALLLLSLSLSLSPGSRYSPHNLQESYVCFLSLLLVVVRGTHRKMSKTEQRAYKGVYNK
jgi:hypothetical protein